MFMGCLAHLSRSGRINSVVKLFVFYVLVMALLCYYEFVNNQLKVLFFTLVLAGIGQILSVFILVNKARKYQELQSYKIIQSILGLFGGLYVITLATGWIPGAAAECNQSRIYPLSFMIYMYLYVIFGIFSLSLYKMNYLMTDAKISEFKEMELL